MVSVPLRPAEETYAATLKARAPDAPAATPLAPVIQSAQAIT
tara:strand:- start:253 stop:378 length:126 start_codon:yes stop_codon:yes gene_type:complete